MRDETKLSDVFSKLEKHNVSLKQFSKAAGFDYSNLMTLKREKSNSRILDLQKRVQEKIKHGLRNTISMDIMIDYVRIRFKTCDYRKIMEKVLFIKPKYFIAEGHGFYGYSDRYVHGDIFVLTSEDEEKGTLLEMRGKGCRQFEEFLKVQGREWRDFFNVCMLYDCVPKRVDLAINDRIGILDIPELVRKMQDGECHSVFKTYQNVASGRGSIYREESKNSMGATLYLGSMKSEIYFCIYEKDYERLSKEGIALEDTDIQNRFELRLTEDRCRKAIEHYLGNDDIEDLAFGIINRYICFLEPITGVDKRHWDMTNDWRYFIGLDRCKVRLTVEPKLFDMIDTKNWISHQVAPTLKFLEELDNLRGTNELEYILENTTLSDRYKQMLEKERASISQKVVKENYKEDKVTEDNTQLRYY